MRYLFTYKNGKKALGLSTVNRGLAFRLDQTTVYPLLVATSAGNASCVRMKVNNEIKSIAYVPALVIPGVLCAKEGSTYIDPTGATFYNTFYTQCFYDRYYGHYIATSSFKSAGGQTTKKIAISLDGQNWEEKGHSGTSVGYSYDWAMANTKKGVIIFYPELVALGGEYYSLVIYGKVYRKTGNGIESVTLFSKTIWSSIDTSIYDITTIRLKVATDGENGIALYCSYDYTSYGYVNTDDYFYFIDINTSVSTYINNHSISALWFNKVLGRYYYIYGSGCYYSNDGLNYTYMEGGVTAPISYGNINGLEVFENGLSSDGETISQSYNYRPNAYDPTEKKYIRVETGWIGTGQGSDKIFYTDVYESTDLNNWTRVVTKYNPTEIYPQRLETVNTDGFACVQGF